MYYNPSIYFKYFSWFIIRTTKIQAPSHHIYLFILIQTCTWYFSLSLSLSQASSLDWIYFVAQTLFTYHQFIMIFLDQRKSNKFLSENSFLKYNLLDTFNSIKISIFSSSSSSLIVLACIVLGILVVDVGVLGFGT